MMKLDRSAADRVWFMHEGKDRVEVWHRAIYGLEKCLRISE
jgi:hypothetical protein